MSLKVRGKRQCLRGPGLISSSCLQSGHREGGEARARLSSGSAVHDYTGACLCLNFPSGHQKWCPAQHSPGTALSGSSDANVTSVPVGITVYLPVVEVLENLSLGGERLKRYLVSLV